jgi:hypothetical protein
MNDLTADVNAALDVAEARARAATSGPWWDSPVAAAPGRHTIRGGPHPNPALGADVRPVARIYPAPAEDGTFVTNHDADAAFIVANDPIHALRIVAGHRAIMERHTPVADRYSLTGFVCSRCNDGSRSVATDGAVTTEPATWPCADLLDLAAIYQVRPSFADTGTEL